MDLCTKEVFDSLDQWPSTHWISGPHPFFGLRGRPSAVTEFPPVFGRPLTTETLRKHPSRRSLWRPPTGSLLTPIVPTESQRSDRQAARSGTADRHPFLAGDAPGVVIQTPKKRALSRPHGRMSGESSAEWECHPDRNPAQVVPK